MANPLAPPPQSVWDEPERRPRRNPARPRGRSFGETFWDPLHLEEFSEHRINPRLFAPRGGRRNPSSIYMGLRGLQEGIKWGMPTNPVDLALGYATGGLGALGWRAARRRLGPPLRRGLRGGWNRGVNLSRMLGRQAQRGMQQLQSYWPQRVAR